MRLRQVVLAAAGLLAMSSQGVRAQQSLDGVWTVIEVWDAGPNEQWRINPEEKQPHLFIFWGGYYSVAGVGGTAPRELLPEGLARTDLSAEQAAATWIPYTSNSGTYVVDGSTLIARPMVALLPNSMVEGFEWRAELAWDGADLLLTESGGGGPYTARLRRLR